MLLVLLAAVGLPLVSQAGAPSSSSLPSREEELAAIRRQMATLEDRLDHLEERKSGLEGKLERTQVELQLQQARVKEAEAALALTVERIDEGRREVARLETALATARRGLRRRAAGLYRLGRQGTLRLFLSVRPEGDLLEALRILRYLVRRDSQVVRVYVDTRDQLDAERRSLADRRKEMERWTTQEQERRRDLLALRHRQERLLADVEQERRSVVQRAEALSEKERKLTRLVNLLYGSSGDAVAGRSIETFRGVLDWPVEGKVTVPFGPRSDPRYRTQVPHNGVDIGTEDGQEVRVVYPGKVLFAAPFQGYGDTVVVHHPGRVFTLYAGLEALRVKKNDVLSFGDVVGLSSDDLYFEIRVENRPEDPLKWLR